MNDALRADLAAAERLVPNRHVREWMAECGVMHPVQSAY